MAMAEFKVPAGFAATVAGDLLKRARAYNAEYLPVWAEWVEPRVALMTELAVVVAGRGERDDLLSALAAFHNGKWEPGRLVERLLAEEVLTVPEPSAPGLATEDAKRSAQALAQLPNANRLLYRLIAAYMGDVVEIARKMRDRAAAELVAQQPDARIEALEMRVAVAERDAAHAKTEAARAAASEEQLMQQNGKMRAELRHLGEIEGLPDPDAYVVAVLEGHSPQEQQVTSVAPGQDADASLPKGIRPRNGRFHAYLTRAETADNRQRGIGTFGSLEEAVAARDDALRQEAEQVAA